MTDVKSNVAGDGGKRASIRLDLAWLGFA